MMPCRLDVDGSMAAHVHVRLFGWRMVGSKVSAGLGWWRIADSAKEPKLRTFFFFFFFSFG